MKLIYLDSENVSMPGNMAQQLKMADKSNAARYDAAAKELVTRKSVLTYVLKSAMPEYKAFPVQEIARDFIVGSPEVRTVACTSGPSRQNKNERL